MTYTPTPAQSEALKNGATQLRAALDPQPDAHAPIRECIEFEPNVWVFLNGFDGSIVERAVLPFAPGDTFPVGGQAATVTAVRVERHEGEWVAVATVEMKGE